LKEKDSYEQLSNWLQKNYYVSKDHLRQDAQIRFGSLKTRCDTIGYELKDIDDEPACRELAGVHLFECKFDYAATQAYGQLLFYKEILQRYMNSKHHEAFNTDYYEGLKKCYQKNGRFPGRWKSTYWLSNKIQVQLRLALLETGYVDDTFIKVVEGSLDDFLGGSVGLLILSRATKRWRITEKREATDIVIERKRGPKPSHQMEPPIADIFYQTRLDCRRFKDEVRNYWCSETSIEPQRCESCEFHVRV
jgi:hypothetical protein